MVFSFIISGAEVAYFSLSYKEINVLKTKQHPSARRILDLLDEPKSLLASLSITNALINIAIIILANFLIDELTTIDSNFFFALLVKILLITSVIILFSEVLPKVWASQNNLRFAYYSSLPILAVHSVFKGLSNWMVGYSDRIEKSLGGGKSSAYTLEELDQAIDMTTSVDATEEEKNMLKGIIKFKPVGGEETTEVFETTYEVAAPNLVVSPTKMNVFYRGVDNPVSISVSGYSDKDIRPSMSNGTLSKGSEGWIVKPGKDAEATISATVTNPDGTSKTMTGMKFRVKNVPSPTPYFAGKSVNDETIKKTELTAAAGVIAKMIDFEFDLKFEVTEYRVTMIIGGTPIEKMTKGAAVSGDMKEMFQKAKPGQKVYIEGIKARGPDGTTRNLGSLSFKVV